VKNLTWQNPEQLFVAQELINKVKSKCCGIKEEETSDLIDKISMNNSNLYCYVEGNNILTLEFNL